MENSVFGRDGAHLWRVAASGLAVVLGLAAGPALSEPFSCAAPPPPVDSPAHKTFNGDWVAPMNLGTLRSWIEFRVTDSRVVVVNGINPKAVTGQAIFDGSAGHIDLGARGAYDGPVDFQNNLWTARWFAPNASSQVMQFTRRPQTPVAPFPYRSEDVTFHGADGAVLAGTVTAPGDAGPHPAVVLIAGFQADRDEVAKGVSPAHRPFAVLADQLTRQGFVVLRYDARGVGGSGGNALTDPETQYEQDVAAGVALLKGRPDVDPKKVGLVGHDTGGLLAGQAAAADPTVAFVVLLDSPGTAGQLALVPANSAYARFFATHDPAADLGKVRQPVLVLTGEKDGLVPPDNQLPPIRAALKANPRADVCVIPGLGHQLRPATTGSADEAEQSMVTVDPTALGPMTAWLSSQAQ